MPAPAAHAPAGARDTARRGRGALIRRRFLRNRLAVVAVVFLVLLLAAAYVLPHFLTWSYTQNDWNALGAPPSAAHWFGTSQPGVDMLALILRGLQKSLVIGLVGGPLTTFVAAMVGASAGYFGGWVDRVLMWVVELMLVVPSFLVLAIIAPKLAGGTWLVFVVLLAAFGWMITARVVRSMTQTLRDREYVLAARYMGVNPMVIIFRHILPNVASILIVDATIQVGAVVLSESGLSYFGFGIQPPDISLGTLVATGEPAATTSPWMFFFPAGFLVLMGLATAFIGDGLRDAFDPAAAGAKSRSRKAEADVEDEPDTAGPSVLPVLEGPAS
jgi:peptide/nickel transport system permease protein